MSLFCFVLLFQCSAKKMLTFSWVGCVIFPWDSSAGRKDDASTRTAVVNTKVADAIREVHFGDALEAALADLADRLAVGNS